MLEEIDKYFAIVAATVISVGSMLLLEQDLALGVIASAITGIFALAGTGPKKA